MMKIINEKEWAEVFGVEPAATVAVADKETEEMSWVLVNPELIDVDVPNECVCSLEFA